jgi:lipopolysaccharide transport system ATP-binding protein
MGMKRAEVVAQFDAIVEFAGVGSFIDTQIKRYSSGMNARLGFSIAAHLQPEVLIIDEVLSVGDMAFQERCVNRMRAFKRQGVTIVFVSHNLQAVNDLCDVALCLKRTVQAFGQTSEVLDRYVRDSFTSATTASSTGLEIRRVELQDGDGEPTSGHTTPGSRCQCVVEFEALEPLHDINFAFRVLRSTDQLVVYDGHFSQEELGCQPGYRGPFRVKYVFDAHLTRNQYFIDVFARHSPTQQYLARLTPAAHLTVSEARTWGGVADLNVAASVSHDPHVSQEPAAFSLHPRI